MNLRLRYEQQTPLDCWVWDGRGHNQRRRDIFADYKMNRSPVAEDVYAQVRLWRKLLRWSPAMQIEVEGWESDDVIGTLVRKYPGRFEVFTNDADYLQISHLCKLNGVRDLGVPHKWIPLYKALVGDKSDNIPGITGFGHKRWEAMAEHWPAIQQGIVDGRMADLPFTPAIKAWLMEPDNVAKLQCMLTITYFQNVPDDEIEGGTTKGAPDRLAAHQLLSEFFM